MVRLLKLFSSSFRTLQLRATRAFPDFLLTSTLCIVVVLLLGDRYVHPRCGSRSERIVRFEEATKNPWAAASNAEFDAHEKSYVFVFSTGRSGTQHLSRSLQSLWSPRSYITHEEEHMTARTRDIVNQVYRRMGALSDERMFNASSSSYVREVKLPFYDALMHEHGARRVVYTGHVPLVFGLGPALLRGVAPGAIRVVRLRRERLATALSLMALGPAEEDPWGEAVRARRRWFPLPTDAFVRLRVSVSDWEQLNRFQRWLWYVDDVECRWQALKREFAGRFGWVEVNLEGLAVMDGGQGWRELARFMGVSINTESARRHNSIQSKGRVKERAEEKTLREWDEQYRSIVGECKLDAQSGYHWQ